MKKILYLMHVDWCWIKQRPHFLAEGLSNWYDVEVMYIPAKKDVRKHLQNNKTSSALSLKKFIKVPYSGRSEIALKIQRLLNGILCNLTAPNIVWICSPEILYKIDFLVIKDKVVIYDCMDDMIESHTISKYKNALMSMEKDLIEASAIIFVSSDSLYNKMLERGARKKQLTTIYNATDLNSIRAISNLTFRKNDFFTITYFGTISSWIDIEIIERLLNDNELHHLRIKMIGPSEITLPNHERFIHIGPVSHNKLSGFVADNDLFILPFILNEITIKVDPVKLYEYIAFHGNIAARFYVEIQRYNEFVYFYNNYDELKNIITKLMKNNQLKYKTDRAEKFLSSNTWDDRLMVIVDKLIKTSKNEIKNQ